MAYVVGYLGVLGKSQDDTRSSRQRFSKKTQVVVNT